MLDNWNADDTQYASSGPSCVSEWRVGSGTIKVTEDATGKKIEAVNTCTLVLEVDLSDLYEHGWVREIIGSMSAESGKTVDDCSCLSWSGNELTLSMTTGQTFRGLIIQRGEEV
jgi:hypothetical protein